MWGQPTVELLGDGSAEAILWKSDTQGTDEVISAQTPMEIWLRVYVALSEMWRITRPDYGREAFRARLESFPNRQLGDRPNVSVADVMEYLSGDDWLGQTFCSGVETAIWN